jgi:hypothetical protein
MQHQPNRRTVTTVGLPARKEQLIKSMLLAVSAQTLDEWAFIEEVEADVAICEIDSPLASVTVARARQAGRPQCIWLAPPETSAPSGRRLDDPIGSTSLIALLDEVSGELEDGDEPLAVPAVVDKRSSEAPFAFATTLRDLLSQGGDPVRVVKAGIELQVGAAGHIQLSHELSDAVVRRLVDPADSARVERVLVPAALPALPHAARRAELLWLLGIAGGGDRLLAPLTDTTPVVLKQWPDFGRLTPVPVHMQLTARLVRRPHTVGELAAALSVAVTDVRAFLNAATLCGLIDTRPIPPYPAPDGPVPAPATTRYGGILRSIRSALGLGGQ